jgi:signal transduction histidine kinase
MTQTPKPGKQFFRYYLPLFLLFSVSILIFQWNREKKYKSDLLDTRLSDTNELVYKLFESTNGDFKSVDSLLAMWNHENIRVTIVDLKGVVVYDNEMKENISKMENHINRPEIHDASLKHEGSDIRLSASTNKHYYYRATRYGNCYVRSSYPFDLKIDTLLSPDNLFLYFWLFLTFAGVTILFYFTSRVNIQMQRVQLEHDAQVRRQLTQQVAHELKTPLTSIVGYMETLHNNPDLEAERKNFYIERSHSQAIRLNELLQDLLLLNQLNEAPKSIKMEPLFLNKVIQTVIDDVQLNLNEKNIQVELSLPEEIWIKGNNMLIYSIFRNLIDNSLAYGGEGITIGISLEQQDQKNYYFKYWDTGKGVENQHLEFLFDRFYRVDKGRSRKKGGTGLGLAIVKNAIELHRGSIGVQNRQDGGLVFNFSLHL